MEDEDILYDEDGEPIDKGELVNVYEGSVARGNKAVRARWGAEMAQEAMKRRREEQDIYADEDSDVPRARVPSSRLGEVRRNEWLRGSAGVQNLSSTGGDGLGQCGEKLHNEPDD